MFVFIFKKCIRKKFKKNIIGLNLLQYQKLSPYPNPTVFI